MIVRRRFLVLAIVGVSTAYAANACPFMQDHPFARLGVSTGHGLAIGALVAALVVTQWRLRVAEEFARIREEMDRKLLREVAEMHNDYMAEVRSIAREAGP